MPIKICILNRKRDRKYEKSSQINISIFLLHGKNVLILSHNSLAVVRTGCVAMEELLAVLLMAAVTTAQHQPCLDRLSVALDNHTVHDNGSVTSRGLLFPNHTVWSKDGTYFGCPCNVTRCLRICPPSKSEISGS